MPRQTCSRGHQWDGPIGNTPASRSANCPVCGSPSVTLPATAAAPAPTAAPRPTVPGYDLIKELGRGGMGVVYLARQKGLNRLVALKMILAAEHAGGQELARFRREAEAIAGLHHPGIVQIYEIGEQQGRPYFSLEYLEGGSLAQRLAGNPQTGRTTAQLVEALARAIHYAHQQGIIHRDLKPANVLLTNTEHGTRSAEGKTDPSLRGSNSVFGGAKITDFGLVKRLEDSSETNTGAVLGTPSYIAPEQAAGKKDVGPPADIYALGAILYEMLTGRPPFRGESPMDTMFQVLSCEPVPPSRLQPKVHRDLETICLKCLNKEPRKRYASAEALADDLQSFLGGETIQARPATRREKLWRWAWRNPLAAALAAVLLAVVATGFFLVAAQWRRAEKNLVAAREQQTRAEENFRQARQAVDDFLLKVSESKLIQTPGLQPLRKELLESALKYYQEFAKQHADDLALQRDLAQVYQRIGLIQEQMGAHADAQVAYEKAQALFQKLSAADPANADLAFALASCHQKMGRLHLLASRHDAGYRSLQSALAILQHAAQDHPADSRFLASAIQIHLLLGQQQASAGRIDEALASFQQLLAQAKKMAQSRPSDRTVQATLAQGEYLLGQLLYEAGQPGEALAYLQRARDQYARLDTIGLADILIVLGDLYRDTNRPAEAQRCYEPARDLLEKQVKLNPKVVYLQHYLGRVYLRVGLLNQVVGKPDLARGALEKVLALLEPLIKGELTNPEIQLNWGRALIHLAAVQREGGKPADGLATAQRAREMLEKVNRAWPEYMDGESELAGSWQEIGRGHEALGQRAEALAAYQKALKNQQVPFGRAPRVVAYARYLNSHYADLGRLHRSAGQFAAIATLTRDRQKLYPTNAGQQYEAAKELARTAVEIGKNKPNLSPAEESERKRYADLALAALRAALTHGFKDAARMQNDPDLAVLRGRADFQALAATGGKG